MSVLLHGSPFSTFTWAARLCLAEKGVAYELIPAKLQDPSYVALHPWRKMPVLEHDGFQVFEAAAVGRYVDEAFEGPALQPASAQGRAQMMQWISAFNDYVAGPAVRGVLVPRFVLAPRGIPVDEAQIQAEAAKAQAALQVFDAALAKSPYLAGDAPSLADWMLLPVIASGGLLKGADRYADNLPNLAAWTGRMTARPSFKATVPR